MLGNVMLRRVQTVFWYIEQTCGVSERGVEGSETVVGSNRRKYVCFGEAVLFKY